MIINYQKFNLTIEAREPLILPHYKGSTFRGGFGNTFKRVVCALRKKDCKDCLLKARCVYAYVFETSPQGDTQIMNMNKYEKIPHPFIIEPPLGIEREYKPSESLSFNLILVGRALDYLAYFIYTFKELGESGIGKGRGRYELKTVKSYELGVEIEHKQIYSSDTKTISPFETAVITIGNKMQEYRASDSQSLTLKFCTPARIVYQRRLVSTLEFHILIRSLMRRLCLLYYFHCKAEAPLWDHNDLIKRAEEVIIEKNSLRWWDWERFSKRQNERMKMGGVIGEITYKGDIEPFLPILKAGEILHLGKGTSFGLGKYEIRWP